MINSILEIKALTIKSKNDPAKDLELIKNINMKIRRNAISCIVGNSGSGKTLLALSMLGLFADDLDVEGEIRFNGENLLTLTQARLKEIRGKDISIVLQSCQGALNPLLINRKQLYLAMREKCKGRKKERALKVLKQVEFSEPEKILSLYPHELSGGMKQRLMMAISLVNQPRLLILDEPTKGMDLILRNQIATMVKELSKTGDRTIVIITHDLELAEKLSDYCYVMSKGQIAEENETHCLFQNPKSEIFKKILAAEFRMKEGFDGKDAIGC